jgi:hypothetical protein
MNDTQSMARQRGGGGGSGGPNQNFGSQRQGSFGGNSNNMGGDGYDNNMNQFNGPPPSNYNSYSGRDGNVGSNYPMNNQTGGGGGVKRENLRKEICFNKRYFIGSMSVSFTMKIRGVPFEAGEKEVFEVSEMSRELQAHVFLHLYPLLCRNVIQFLFNCQFDYFSSSVLLYLFVLNRKVLLVVNHQYGMLNLVHVKKQPKH